MNQEVEQLVRKYIKEGRFFQLATVNGDQPWSCTLYYASDEELNIFWISKPDTRHSKEIDNQPKVAASIPIKFDDLTVVGLQLEGTASLVEDSLEINEKVKLYCDKFKRGEDWFEEFISGSNPHKLYKLKPNKFVVFDRVNFSDDSRKEWQP